MNNLQSSILEAMNTVMKSAPDTSTKVIEAVVKESIDEGVGKYKLTYMNNPIVATLLGDGKLTPGTQVYVMLPNGTLGDNNIILNVPKTPLDVIKQEDIKRSNEYIEIARLYADDSNAAHYMSLDFNTNKTLSLFSDYSDILKSAFENKNKILLELSYDVKTSIEKDYSIDGFGDYGLSIFWSEISSTNNVEDGSTSVEREQRLGTDSGFEGNKRKLSTFQKQRLYLNLENSSYNFNNGIQLQLYCNGFDGQSVDGDGYSIIPPEGKDYVVIKNIQLRIVRPLEEALVGGNGLLLKAEEGNTFSDNLQKIKKITPTLYVNYKECSLDNCTVEWKIKSILEESGYETISTEKELFIEAQDFPQHDYFIQMNRNQEYECFVVLDETTYSAKINITNWYATSCIKAVPDNYQIGKEAPMKFKIIVYDKDKTKTDEHLGNFSFNMYININGQSIPIESTNYNLINQSMKGYKNLETLEEDDSEDPVYSCYCYNYSVEYAYNNAATLEIYGAYSEENTNINFGYTTCSFLRNELKDYKLYVINDNVQYKYDKDGRYTRNKDIKPLTYKIQDPEGRYLDDDLTRYNGVELTWCIPKDSLYNVDKYKLEESSEETEVDISKHTFRDDENYYYIGMIDNDTHSAQLVYDINKFGFFSNEKAAARLIARIDNSTIETDIDIDFSKSGALGTNVTEYTCTIESCGEDREDSVEYNAIYSDLDTKEKFYKKLHIVVTPNKWYYYDYEDKKFTLIEGLILKKYPIIPRLFYNGIEVTNGEYNKPKLKVIQSGGKSNNSSLAFEIHNDGGMNYLKLKKYGTVNMKNNLIQVSYSVPYDGDRDREISLFSYYPIEVTVIEEDSLIDQTLMLPSFKGGCCSIKYSSNWDSPEVIEGDNTFEIINNNGYVNFNKTFGTKNTKFVAECGNNFTINYKEDEGKIILTPNKNYDLSGNTEDYIGITLTMDSKEIEDLTKDRDEAKTKKEKLKNEIDNYIKDYSGIVYNDDNDAYNPTLPSKSGALYKYYTKCKEDNIYGKIKDNYNKVKKSGFYDNKRDASKALVDIIDNATKVLKLINKETSRTHYEAIESLKNQAISVREVLLEYYSTKEYDKLPSINKLTVSEFKTNNLRGRIASFNTLINKYNTMAKKLDNIIKETKSLNIEIFSLLNSAAVECLNDTSTQYKIKCDKYKNLISNFNSEAIGPKGTLNVINAIAQPEYLGDFFVLDNNVLNIKATVQIQYTLKQANYLYDYNSLSSKVKNLDSLIKLNKVIRHYRPIICYMDRSSLAHFESWDGKSIEIGNDKGYILAPQIGAGRPDTNNTWTGFFMGQRELDNAKEVGIYGLNKSNYVFELKEDGSAIFGGKKGVKINIDSDNLANSSITSGNHDYFNQHYGKQSSDSKGFYLGAEGLCIGSRFMVDSEGNLSAQNFKLNDATGSLHSNGHNDFNAKTDGFYIGKEGLSIGGKVSIDSDGSATLTFATLNNVTINGTSDSTVITMEDGFKLANGTKNNAYIKLLIADKDGDTTKDTPIISFNRSNTDYKTIRLDKNGHIKIDTALHISKSDDDGAFIRFGGDGGGKKYKGLDIWAYAEKTDTELTQYHVIASFE